MTREIKCCRTITYLVPPAKKFKNGRSLAILSRQGNGKCHLRMLHFLSYIRLQGFTFVRLTPFLIYCVTACLLRYDCLCIFDRNIKIGIHYSTLELRGDIRTIESTHCTSLNNKNIYQRLRKTHIVILRIWKQ